MGLLGAVLNDAAKVGRRRAPTGADRPEAAGALSSVAWQLPMARPYCRPS